MQAQNFTANLNPIECRAYRELPVSQFSQGKTCFHNTGNPVLIAGILFSLQGFPRKPLYIPVQDCSARNKGLITDLDFNCSVKTAFRIVSFFSNCVCVLSSTGVKAAILAMIQS